MLICIDGSGPRSDFKYVKRMEQSFVRTIYLESALTALDSERSAALPPHSSWPSFSRGPYKLYRRGPDGVGSELVLPESLAGLVKHLWDSGDHQIFMAGFSRGGAIVINTASLLRKMTTQDGSKIEVESLFLFDAVDRLFYLDGKTIPSNVRHCYHAIRNRKDGKSRESFRNCGLSRESPDTEMVENRDFHTTHGGMGGLGYGEGGIPAWKDPGDPLFSSNRPPVPWSSREEKLAQGFIVESFPDGPTKITVAQEATGTIHVQRWMWKFLRHHRVFESRPATDFYFA